MKAIFISLDGSELSQQALGLGQVLARAYNAQVSLIHVLEEPMVFDLLPGLVIPNRLEAETYLRRVAAGFPADITVDYRVLRGKPVDVLLDLTADDPESMIVMSTHGRSGLGRLMLGSVADKVVRHASVPVVLASETAIAEDRLRTILVPLDTSRFSEMALPIAADLARRTGATLGLVHVCEPFWVSSHSSGVAELSSVNDVQASDIERESLINGRDYLDRLADDLRVEGLRVVWEVRFGKPADEIIRAARTTDADLIVMATHNRSGLRRLALGSVTNEVLHHGTAPILAIPPHLIHGQEDFAAELLSTL